MFKEMINVGSVTYAMEGRDLLRSKGFKAYIRRTPYHGDRKGCGYSLEVDGDLSAAEAVLRQNGIKLRGRSQVSRQ